MKVLVLGSGGREHALVWKLRQSPRVQQVYCIPGNAGIASEAEIEPGDVVNAKAMADAAAGLGVDVTVTGPEAPLVAGVADEFLRRKLPIVGPTAGAARLEGSKIFAKEFMRRHNIPTAEFQVCDSAAQARECLARFGFPVVLKADGLAAGKGVVVARDAAEANLVLEQMLSGKLVGDAGRRVVLERHLRGDEVSFIVLTDGKAVLSLPPTQDHKAVFDNDQGPNTGGMGAYCDDGIISAAMRQRIMRNIVRPTLAGMAAEGSPYSGFLYVGLMMTSDGPQVLEYNARMGDPETQPILMRLNSDFATMLYSAATGRLHEFTPEWLPGASVCIVAASAGYPGPYEQGKPISGIPAAESISGVKVFHAGTRYENGLYVTAGGRVLGITAVAPDLPQAIHNAYQALEHIHFDGMHYRRDIGKKGVAKGNGS